MINFFENKSKVSGRIIYYLKKWLVKINRSKTIKEILIEHYHKQLAVYKKVKGKVNEAD